MTDLLAKDEAFIEFVKDEADRSENINEKRDGDRPLGGTYSPTKQSV